MSDDSEAWKGEPEEPQPMAGWASYLFGKPMTAEQKAKAAEEEARRKAAADVHFLMLPGYRPAHPCVKCGHPESKTRYCSGTGGSYNICYKAAGEREHFHRACKRCRYTWYEKTLSEEES